MICAGGAPGGALTVLTELIHCCAGAAQIGPGDCTCWEPIYDRDQAEPDEASAPVVGAQCTDCAYRADSPERAGDERYVSIEDVPAGAPFFCHRGMRKPTAWRHPAGITVEATGDFYDPPIIHRGRQGVPYKADGSAGDICAGWAARDREDAAVVASMLAEVRA